jgi:hypothetical protein
MSSTPRRTSWRTVRRRLCGGVTLAAYLAATVSFPLPAAARKAADQPFPCQNHPCGCLTAEECWAHCCCFTPEERWAWAEEHHVQPPAYAERPGSQGWRTARLRDRAEGRTPRPAVGSCCSAPGSGHHQQTPCTQGCSPETRKPCCTQGPHGSSQQSAPAESSAGTKGKLRWTLGAAALKCRGLATLWTATGAAVPPSPPLIWRPCLEADAWLSWRHEGRTAQASTPLEPPPRLVGV